MTITQQKIHKRSLRRRRVRSRVTGTEQRPRLSVFRSASHIYAQIIDDATGRTLAAASSKPGKGEKKATGKKTDAATEVGKQIAAKAKELKVTAVVFDRGGYKYHGRVKAVADAAREAGLQF